MSHKTGNAFITRWKLLRTLTLIRKVHNFRPSIRAASRKLTRVYHYHPTLALPYGITEESFAEGIVIANLGVLFYWREHNRDIDALYGSTPVEVKFKSKIDKGDAECLFCLCGNSALRGWVSG